MLSLIGTLIIGLIVGAIAKLIVRGDEPAGCLITIAIGVAGSFLAFYIGKLLGWNSGHPRPPVFPARISTLASPVEDAGTQV